jgi:hypothetical protein
MALGSIRTRRANMVRSVDLGGHGIGASSQHVKVSNQPVKQQQLGPIYSSKCSLIASVQIANFLMGCVVSSR